MNKVETEMTLEGLFKQGAQVSMQKGRILVLGIPRNGSLDHSLIWNCQTQKLVDERKFYGHDMEQICAPNYYLPTVMSTHEVGILHVLTGKLTMFAAGSLISHESGAYFSIVDKGVTNMYDTEAQRFVDKMDFDSIEHNNGNYFVLFKNGAGSALLNAKTGEVVIPVGEYTIKHIKGSYYLLEKGGDKKEVNIFNIKTQKMSPNIKTKSHTSVEKLEGPCFLVRNKESGMDYASYSILNFKTGEIVQTK